jgi:hypothetical protein
VGKRTRSGRNDNVVRLKRRGRRSQRPARS